MLADDEVRPFSLLAGIREGDPVTVHRPGCVPEPGTVEEVTRTTARVHGAKYMIRTGRAVIGHAWLVSGREG